MKKILLALSLIFSLSQADSFNKHRNIVHHPHHSVAKTVYVNHHNQRYHRNDRIAGVLIGGIIGGLLGNQIGYGDERPITTMGGIVIGSTLGSSIAHRRYNRRVVHYNPHYRWERSKSYRPNHRWERSIHADRDRFYDREHFMARRHYR